MKKYAWVKRTDRFGRVQYHNVVNPKWVYQNYTGPRLRRQIKEARENYLKSLPWHKRMEQIVCGKMIDWAIGYKLATKGAPAIRKGTIWNPGPMSTTQFMVLIALILMVVAAVFAH